MNDGGIDPLVFQDRTVAGALGVEVPPTPDEIATFMAGQPLQFDPGSDWGYCNFGYLLLGMLAEQATGRDFVELVLDDVFRRVGVGRARIGQTLEADLAPGQVAPEGVFEGDPHGLTAENLFAAGSQVMAAPDLARVLSVLFDDDDAGGLLSRETRSHMLELPFPASQALGYGRGWIQEGLFNLLGHTMGWLTDPGDGEQLYGHTGGGPGEQGVAVWHSSGLTFVWLSNKDPMVEDLDDLPAVGTWPTHDLWASVGIGEGPIGSAPTEVWIPVVAHGPGAQGSEWRSDVGLLNRSPLPNRVRLRAYPAGSAPDLELDLAAGGYAALSDVLGSLGVTGSAPLRVFSWEPLSVASRTYSTSPDGTFGQQLAASPATQGLDSGDSAVLMQLAEDAAARSNIGLLNPDRRAAEVEVVLYDGRGTQLQAFTESVPPGQTVQLNRPFLTRAGRTDLASGYAVVRVRSGRGVVAYASVVDNASNDPTTIPMQGTTGAPHQWVAAAAHAAGAHDSLWRTDLGLLNLSGAAATVSVFFHGDDGGSATRTLVLDSGAQEVTQDVVGELGAAGGGSLEVLSDRPLLVCSRTYSSGSDGTFGQSLDGADPGDAARGGEVLWLPLLRQDGAFRTNLGLLNSGEAAAALRLRLFDADGNLLHDRQLTLAAGERSQLNQPFSTLAGRDDVAAGYASLEVVSGAGVVAYASVVDNSSNDPTTVPAMR